MSFRDREWGKLRQTDRLKGRFHETTKHADESTFGRPPRANVQKLGLCHRLVLSDDQYPFIFPLNCGQRPDIVRPIEIDLFGRLERLEWTTKQSSDRPTKKIRHVKYFAQKPRRPINSSVTLDVQGSILVVGSQKNILSAHCTVISESQRPNFGRQSYFLLNLVL